MVENTTLSLKELNKIEQNLRNILPNDSFAVYINRAIYSSKKTDPIIDTLPGNNKTIEKF